MFVGREQELADIVSLLDRARAGRSEVLAVVGDIGIGKSELLRQAERLATGMTVLRARGAESEAKVPFAALSELLRPVLGYLENIPGPQRAALEAALALRPSKGEDRFAVGAATLSLLAAVSETAPVLVVIDDAHWVDGSTADALSFAFRRLLADPVAVLIAVREGEVSPLVGSDRPTVRLGGLDRQAAQELIEHRGLTVAEKLADRLYRQACGNPLALVEMASDRDWLDNLAPIDVPLPVDASVARIYVQRYKALPPASANALLVTAADDVGDLAVIARAARSLGAGLDDLEPAEAAGLVRLGDGRAEFCHPLARAAIYGDAAPAMRRNAHRAVADALPDAEFDRRAWHRALAAIGPDDAACSALEQAGRHARERSAYEVSARAFERASRLATHENRVVRLLYDAANAAWLAGESNRAVTLLDQLQDHEVPGDLQVYVDELRGHMATRLGPVQAGHKILVTGAERALGTDPERAVIMLAEAVNAAFYAADAEAMTDAAARLAAVGPLAADGRSHFFSSMAQGMALIFSGEGERGAKLLRASVDMVTGPDHPGPDHLGPGHPGPDHPGPDHPGPGHPDGDPRLLAWAAMGPLWLRENGAGGGLMTRAVDTARRHAAVGVLPFALSHLGVELAGSSQWAEAEAVFEEAIELARQTDQRTELAAVLSRLAGLQARQGRQAECRKNAAEALTLSREIGAVLCEIWALAALGELELGLGDMSSALARLTEQEHILHHRGIADADLSPAPDLVELHLRRGARDEATRYARVASDEAARKRQPWALARAARCGGLVAGDTDFDVPFSQALAFHAQTPDLFEAARTRLCYGGRLRRARRRLDARKQLRQAIEVLDRLGATLWSDVARTELAATGETARRRDPSFVTQLSPQERNVCLLLAEGRTTREAAALLFLSPKTVEFHLRSAYRKLGINSRAGLAESFSASKSGGADVT